MKKYIVEFFGTCVLSLAVLGSITLAENLPGVLTAGITLGLLVFTIGKVSGAHVNPAVSIGAWSLRKISNSDLCFYILAQFAGAALALIIARLSEVMPPLVALFSPTVLLAEILGTFVFTFGIASVVLATDADKAKTTDLTPPVVVGGSLTLGATIAAGLGSNGILNPAVAFALGSFGCAYIVGPIVGSLLGMYVYSCLVCDCEADSHGSHSRISDIGGFCKSLLSKFKK
jgi:glycerol uptake facilitator-like aquaporin